LEQEAVRLPALLQPHTFRQITELIQSEMRVLCCHRSEIAGTQFRRPVYIVEVDRPLFDLFFNSPSGYRAAYFESPGAGLDANISFMRAIGQRLAGEQCSLTCGLQADFLRESLSSPSAKAWLAEHGKEVDLKCPTCRGEWSASGAPGAAEIRNGRWDIANDLRAEWGSKAPYLTKLRVMGAFLDERYNEFVPGDKRFRAEDIHHFGWS
jgi:hypothetical protein